MAASDDSASNDADPLMLGRRAASLLVGTWQLDLDEPAVAEENFNEQGATTSREDADGAVPAARGVDLPRAPRQETPPSPEQIIEAMLFVSGHPLTVETACTVVRGLSPEQFSAAIESLNRRYREQWRPYTIDVLADGFALVVRPMFRNLRERLFGGPLETNLSQLALDVLAVVAYRQPVGKAEVDAIRGTDSSATLRQLVRLGLIAVQHRADAAAREVRYGTTPRFLQVFGLYSLDELPRLGDPQKM